MFYSTARSIDNRATATTFRTAYVRYANEVDAWFDGTPQSIDGRIARANRLMHLAKESVARQGMDAEKLASIAELQADVRALTALRRDLLTAASGREDTSPVAEVDLRRDRNYNPMIEELSNTPAWKHDEVRQKYEDARRNKEGGLSPADRRFVVLESARFLADNADTDDVRELATRAQHFAQRVTSTYSAGRSQAVTTAFVRRVASAATQRREADLHLRKLLQPLLEGISDGTKGMEDLPADGPGQALAQGLAKGLHDVVPPKGRRASITELPPETMFL